MSETMLLITKKSLMNILIIETDLLLTLKNTKDQTKKKARKRIRRRNTIAMKRKRSQGTQPSREGLREERRKGTHQRRTKQMIL